MINTSLFFAAVLAVTGAEVQADTPQTSAASDHSPTAAGAREIVVNLLDGKTISGAVMALSVDQVTIQSDGHAVTLPSKSLLSVAPQKPPEPSAENPSAWIELIDGSKLTGTAFAVKKATAAISIGGEGCEIPTSAIRSVRFSKPGDPSSPSWPTKVGADAASDLLAVRKKDAVDFNEGVLVSVNENHVVFQLDGESVPVARSKVDGLIFFHKTDDSLPDPSCIVDSTDGWRLKAKEISLSGSRLALVTTSGQTLRLPLDTIVRLDYSTGKVLYLSDLDPDSVRWTPYLDIHNASEAMEQFYAPRRDEGREHQPLVTGGKKYTKGLALYSRTEMTYRLPVGAKKFKAIAGIDDSVRDVGGVRLVISADGKKIFDKSISGSEGPVDIDLDIADAKRLTLLVDYGAGLDAGDYLDLAEARILK